MLFVHIFIYGFVLHKLFTYVEIKLRVTGQKIVKGRSVLDEKSYLWGTGKRLLSVMINGERRRYEYNGRGFLVKTFFEDGSLQLRIPDRMGNLFIYLYFVL